MGMERKTCNHCFGMGTVENWNSTGPGRVKCSNCGGTGHAEVYVNESFKSKPKYHSIGNRRDNIENFSQVIGISIFAFIAYIGLTKFDMEWYWPVGVGTLIGTVVYKALSGPLRLFTEKLLKVLIWTLVIAAMIFFANIYFETKSGRPSANVINNELPKKSLVVQKKQNPTKYEYKQKQSPRENSSKQAEKFIKKYSIVNIHLGMNKRKANRLVEKHFANTSSKHYRTSPTIRKGKVDELMKANSVSYCENSSSVKVCKKTKSNCIRELVNCQARLPNYRMVLKESLLQMDESVFRDGDRTVSDDNKESLSLYTFKVGGMEKVSAVTRTMTFDSSTPINILKEKIIKEFGKPQHIISSNERKVDFIYGNISPPIARNCSALLPYSGNAKTSVWISENGKLAEFKDRGANFLSLKTFEKVYRQLSSSAHSCGPLLYIGFESALNKTKMVTLLIDDYRQLAKHVKSVTI